MPQKPPIPPISDQLIINPAIGQGVIIGVDEVGRGCLFGHMTVVALALPRTLSTPLPQLTCPALTQLNDSKKLTHKQREQLFTSIKKIASFAVVNISASIIDHINIHNATLLGMKTAIQTLAKYHSPQAILIDGKHLPSFDDEFAPLADCTQAIIQGDSQHSSIACASIVAKICRDRAMMTYAEHYPAYGLEQHKGYPTAKHKEAIAKFGVLPEHRRSYTPIQQTIAIANCQTVR